MTKQPALSALHAQPANFGKIASAARTARWIRMLRQRNRPTARLAPRADTDPADRTVLTTAYAPTAHSQKMSGALPASTTVSLLKIVGYILTQLHSALRSPVLVSFSHEVCVSAGR